MEEAQKVVNMGFVAAAAEPDLDPDHPAWLYDQSPVNSSDHL